MRSLSLILITGVVALWVYYGTNIAPLPDARPVAVAADGKTLSAGTLNNKGVELDRRGDRADALVYIERARDFRPHDKTIKTNLERQRARVKKIGWIRALVPASILTFLFFVFSLFWGAFSWVRDRARLGRVRLRGDPWMRVERDDKNVKLPLHFSVPIKRLLRRHPLTIVWSRNGKHMKSQPPVETKGQAVTVKLNRDRLDRLRQYPGDWKGFLYLGKTHVGDTAARVI